MNFITVSRKAAANRKFNKSNLSFLDSKLDKKRGLHGLVHKEKTNACEPEVIRETKESRSLVENVMNRLDQFSFNTNSQTQNTKKQTSLNKHFAKRKPNLRTRQYKEDNKGKESNILVRNCDVSPMKSIKKIDPKSSVRHFLSSSEDEGERKFINTLKMKYPLMKDY